VEMQSREYLAREHRPEQVAGWGRPARTARESGEF